MISPAMTNSSLPDEIRTPMWPAVWPGRSIVDKPNPKSEFFFARTKLTLYASRTASGWICDSGCFVKLAELRSKLSVKIGIGML